MSERLSITETPNLERGLLLVTMPPDEREPGAVPDGWPEIAADLLGSSWPRVQAARRRTVKSRTGYALMN